MAGPPILVVGASGQLARALARFSAVLDHPVVCRGRPEADLANPASLQKAFDELTPVAVVNAAAYTAVDKAEEEPEESIAANAAGPETLATLCDERGLPFIHVSTDYVFDGAKRRPYTESDTLAPLGVYGVSKAQGEAAIRRVCPRHVILRTSWLYGMEGRSFLTTMLRLGETRDELSIVDDQHGTPTWTHDVAGAICTITRQLIAERREDAWGTYHLTSAGETTWFGFAREIFRLAAARGSKVPRLKPIATKDYPTLAKRPPYSVLDTSKIRSAFAISLPGWQESLAQCFAEGSEIKHPSKVHVA
jgi:dTDP-4-dehydrorhamnose reductase